MIYFYIAIAKFYLFVYKYFKLILATTFIYFLLSFILKDNSLTYQNIQNSNSKIDKVFKDKYQIEGDTFIIDLSEGENKKIKIFVSDNANNQFKFKHLENYNISYIEDNEKRVFEIDFNEDIQKSKIFTSNIFNSYLNNNKKMPNIENRNDYIIYFENNENYFLNDYFYRMISIMLNEEGNNYKLFNTINEIAKPEKCSNIEVFFNIYKDRGRISILCQK